MKTLLWRLWLIVRYRPFFTCPLCRGSGGGKDYWGEWIECQCYDHWCHLEDWGMEWFVGRVPLLRWPHLWLLKKTGLHRSFIGWALCRLGWHRWKPLVDGRICTRCYDMEECEAAKEPTNA